MALPWEMDWAAAASAPPAVAPWEQDWSTPDEDAVPPAAPAADMGRPTAESGPGWMDARFGQGQITDRAQPVAATAEAEPAEPAGDSALIDLQAGIEQAGQIVPGLGVAGGIATVRRGTDIAEGGALAEDLGFTISPADRADMETRQAALMDRGVDRIIGSLPAILESNARLADMPTNPAAAKAMQADSIGAALSATSEDVWGVARTFALRSLPASAPTILAAIAGSALGGPVGGGAAAGSVSMSTEAALSVANVMEPAIRQAGVDPNDPAAVAALIRQDPGAFKEILRDATIRAGIIGAADAATGGVTGALGRWAAAGGRARIAGGAVAGSGVEAAGEGAGEALAGGSPGDVLAEAIGGATMGAPTTAAQTAVELFKGAPANPQTPDPRLPVTRDQIESPIPTQLLQQGTEIIRRATTGEPLPALPAVDKVEAPSEGAAAEATGMEPPAAKAAADSTGESAAAGAPAPWQMDWSAPVDAAAVVADTPASPSLRQPASISDADMNTEDTAILAAAGYGAEDIADMSPAERSAEAAQARAQGVVAPPRAETAAAPDPSYSESIETRAPHRSGKTASWVIREKATGSVVMETFERAHVDALNTAKYEAVPIQDYLGSLNKRPPAQPRSAPQAPATAAPAPSPSEAASASVAPAQATITPAQEVQLRRIGQRIGRLEGEGSPGRGTAVGSTGERAMQEAYALRELTKGIRAGKPPEQAAADAKAAVREVVAKHNERRKGDVNWRVSEGAYDAAVDGEASLYERAELISERQAVADAKAAAPAQPPRAKTSAEAATPVSKRSDDDMRGLSFAVTNPDGTVFTSGSIGSLLDESETTRRAYYEAMADARGGALFVAPQRSEDFKAAGDLIFGMTWDQIQARQQGKTVPAAIHSKMPKDAVEVYAAKPKPKRKKPAPAEARTVADKRVAPADPDVKLSFTLSPEFKSRAEKVARDLKKRLDAMNLPGVKIGVAEKLFAENRRTGAIEYELDGVFNAQNGLIAVAINGSRDPGVTFGHEALHALKAAGLFRDAEWRALEAAARADTKRMQRAREEYPDLDEAGQVEEVIADLYGEWAAGQYDAKGFVRTAFEKIKAFIAALRQSLKGEGFASADAIFGAIERGDVGGRAYEVGKPIGDGSGTAVVRTAISRPRVFYRGTNPGDTRRIKTGKDEWDSYLFAADNRNAASAYGSEIETLEAAPDARILYEGTADWIKVVGRWRKDENLLQYADRAAKAVKAAGYDAAWFKMQGNVGTAIFSPEKFRKPARQARTRDGDTLTGILAFHGSPHDFDAFSMDKIGTGEGAQAYGHGLYFAENEGVAKAYRDALTPVVDAEFDGVKAQHLPWLVDNTPEELALRAVQSEKDIPKARVVLERLAPKDGDYAKALEWFNANEARISVSNPGHMYKVRINADPGDFLDWDKPLSEQPKVRRALDAGLPNVASRYSDADDFDRAQAVHNLRDLLDAPTMTGNRAYQELSEALSGTYGVGGKSYQSGGDVTQSLREAGIPGIRYLDQGSRTAGDGSRNYVVFDDSLVTITRKYARSRTDTPEVKHRRSSAPSLPEETNRQLVWRKIKDDKGRLLQAQRFVAETSGAPIPEHLDAYLAAGLFQTKSAAQLRAYHEGPVAALNDALKKALKSTGAKAADVDAWLIAKHAPARNRVMADRGVTDGSGMSDADAALVVADAQAKGWEPEFENVAQHVYAMLRADVDRRVQSGLISQEEADAWTAMYPDGRYVPLRGWAERADDDPDQQSGAMMHTGRGFDVRGPESRRAKGRSSQADSPLAYAVMMGAEGIVRAGKNQVAKTLYRFAKEYPTSVVEAIGKKPVRSALDLKTGEDALVIDQAALQAANIMAAKIGGKPYYVRLSPELAVGFKNLGVEQLNGITRVMRKFTRYWSSMLTGRNPAFFIPNATVDAMTGLLTAMSNDAPKGFARRYVSNYLYAMSTLWQFNAGIPLTAKQQAMIDEWHADGGRMDLYGYQNLDDIKAEIEGGTDASRAGRAKRLAKQAIPKTLSAVEWLNFPFENAARFASYIAARKSGVSRAKAAMHSLESTGNFMRRGEMTPLIGAWYPFFNASMTGLEQLSRYASKRKTQAVLAGAVMFPAIWALSIASSYPGDDDPEGIPLYFRIPDWERSRSLIIPRGVKTVEVKNADGTIREVQRLEYATVRIPHALRPFWTLGDQFAALYSGVSSVGDVITKTFASTLFNWNPVSGSDPISMALPLIGDPVYELIRNKDGLGRTIRPAGFGEEEKGVRAYSWQTGETSPWAIAAAREMNTLTGGDAVTPGWVSVHPDHLEYLWEFMVGGLGRFVSETAQTAANMAEGVETPPNKRPIIRTAIGETDASVQTSAFYDMLGEGEELAARMNNVKKRVNQGQLGEAEWQEAVELADHLGAKLSRDEDTDWTESWVSVLRKARNATNKIRDEEIAVTMTREDISRAEIEALVKDMRGRQEAIRLEARTRALEMKAARPSL